MSESKLVTALNVELLLCPFCGGKAHLIVDDGSPYDVNCFNCYAGSAAFPDPIKAVNAWNKRAK